MSILPGGLAIAAILALLLWAFGCRPVMLSALFVSLAFGATAVVELPALGGSSPLMYIVFGGLFCAVVVARDGFLRQLGAVFGTSMTSWVVLALLIYTVAGAMLLPRLLEGQASVIVISRDAGTYDRLLAPTGGNIAQTAYFLLGGFLFFALAIELRRPQTLRALRRAMFVFAGVVAASGLIDYIAKLGGAGDVLVPLRTATFAMLTDDSVGGFSRIAGLNSEASSYAGSAMSALAFTFTYWRLTGGRAALVISLLLLALLLASTSTTAYVGLAVFGAAGGLMLLRSALLARLSAQDILVVMLALAVLTLLLGVLLWQEKLLEPFFNLIRAMVFEKSTSSSGIERAYWNSVGLNSVIETGGLGIGFGSSRSSSWAVSVLAQLGILGTIMIVMLIGIIVRGVPADGPLAAVATANGMRAMALMQLVAATVSGGGADPGVFFFMTLAVIISVRAASPRKLPRGLELGAPPLPRAQRMATR